MGHNLSIYQYVVDKIHMEDTKTHHKIGQSYKDELSSLLSYDTVLTESLKKNSDKQNVDYFLVVGTHLCSLILSSILQEKWHSEFGCLL